MKGISQNTKNNPDTKSQSRIVSILIYYQSSPPFLSNFSLKQNQTKNPTTPPSPNKSSVHLSPIRYMDSWYSYHSLSMILFQTHPSTFLVDSFGFLQLLPYVTKCWKTFLPLFLGFLLLFFSNRVNISLFMGKPYIYRGWGVGGRIYRSRLGKDPCLYLCGSCISWRILKSDEICLYQL